MSIPVAVKIGPYFSSIPDMARRLSEAGADGLVIFNRDDFDIVFQIEFIKRFFIAIKQATSFVATIVSKFRLLSELLSLIWRLKITLRFTIRSCG